MAAALDGPTDAAGDLDCPNLRLRGERLEGGVGECDDQSRLVLADAGVAAELAPRPPFFSVWHEAQMQLSQGEKKWHKKMG